VKTRTMIGLIAVVAMMLAVGPSEAALISTYTYGGKDVSVFTLSNWSGAPIGATNVSLNQAFGGTWTVPTGITSIELMVVGGGGSGGGTYSTGGGAGGVVYYGPETVANYLLTPQSSYSVIPGASLTVTVGAGGPARVDLSQGAGNNGSNSQFDAVIAKGGQTGNSPWNVAGGQAGYVDGAPYQGYAGGQTSSGGAGAGGGAGGVGGVDQRGGIGLQIGITGESTYYGGGGGGIGAVNSSYTLGGLGGGGNGSAFDGDVATGGLDNTGGGGGGHWGTNGNGGAGGSGIVIVSYVIPEPATFGMLGAAAVAMLLRRRVRR
jgi:hypothetical protein